MPVGDAQAAFRAAAALDGIQLEPAKVSWINQRGHFGLPEQAAIAAAPLDDIFEDLGGQTDVHKSKRTTALRGDFYHVHSKTFIEIDEVQHFTSFRLRTFEQYPGTIPLGFHLEQYLELCRQHAPRADRYRATKDAVGFGPGGRQRQRAYYDALRDLAVPSMGHPPLIRIPILDGDGAAGYASHRHRVRSALGNTGDPEADFIAAGWRSTGERGAGYGVSRPLRRLVRSLGPATAFLIFAICHSYQIPWRSEYIRWGTDRLESAGGAVRTPKYRSPGNKADPCARTPGSGGRGRR